MHYAVYHENKALITFLIERGAKPDLPNDVSS